MLYFVITSLIGSILILLFTFYSIVSSLVTPLPFLTQSMYLCVCVSSVPYIQTHLNNIKRYRTIPSLPEKRHLEMIKDWFGRCLCKYFSSFYFNVLVTKLYYYYTRREESIFFTSITYTCICVCVCVKRK